MVYIYLSMDVKDQSTFDAYRKVAGEAMTRHSCKVVSVGRRSVVLDGERAAPTVAVILTFDTEQDAHNWIADPELKHIHEQRRASGDVSILMLV